MVLSLNRVAESVVCTVKIAIVNGKKYNFLTTVFMARYHKVLDLNLSYVKSVVVAINTTQVLTSLSVYYAKTLIRISGVGGKTVHVRISIIMSFVKPGAPP